MKKLLLILLLAACNGEPKFKSNYEVRYSPDGKECVALIHHFDGHKFVDFYMPCELYLSLWEKGGYDEVYEYAQSHELPEYWQQRFSTYK